MDMGPILTGGNHLANVLTQIIGPEFAKKYPPDMAPDLVLECFHQKYAFGSAASQHFDIWSCWAAIMRVLETPAQAAELCAPIAPNIPGCSTCAFYNRGNCRRKSPVTVSSWPVVRPDDWCGEHESK